MNGVMNGQSVRMLDTESADFNEQLAQLLERSQKTDPAIDTVVAQIIEKVKQGGDEALVEYTRTFDDLQITTAAELEIPADRLQLALERIDSEQRAAIEQAIIRVRDYHERQRQESWQYAEDDGTVLGQKITALDRVGLYVPGGKAAYPSSVIMTAVPARVAGVGELIMVVPTPSGELNELVLSAARLAGVDRVFAIGGAQAVAALAFGTRTIPRVDKIVGPGNIYVATAKKQVFGQVGIDMIAGPSEVVVVADDSADADWVATDMFAQAEHDELAQAIVVTSSPEFANAVSEAVERLLPDMQRKAIIEKALAGQSAIIKVRDSEQALAVVNRIAPEHLEVFVEQPMRFAEQVRHAGAIFVGQHSAEVLGDYCAGPNHVLPTAGTARFSSPLGVYDFQKRSSIIAASESGARRMAKTASVLARAESLEAHARSAELRLNAVPSSREQSDE